VTALDPTPPGHAKFEGGARPEARILPAMTKLRPLRFRPPDHPRPHRLPARVHAAIEAEEDRSEILIGWVQFGVVAAFGLLYFVSPKTFAADAPFRPVPWVLGAYTAFTLLRLVAAYRTRLPGWFLTLSVAVDVALLLGLIWSFHVQYMQPAAFYLKVPTVLYLFIFIALRALRFQSLYVLVAGGLAALGWLGMVAYAIARSPEALTRDYVHYMTANAILLGAEFDKIVSILVVAGILALAIRRGRRLLERAVAEETAARDLSRFFAPEVAGRIRRAERIAKAGHGDLREATVVFLDVRGFTALAATMPPSDVMTLLADYQARLVPVLQARGGSIDKFLGDGIMATFGASQSSPTHAADAMRAMVETMRTADAWNAERTAAGLAPMIIHAGAAHGTIIFGTVGDPSRLEYTVIGDAVNLAAKIEQANKAEGTCALATEAAYAEALRQGYVPESPCEIRPACLVAGVGRPVDLVVLAAGSEAAA